MQKRPKLPRTRLPIEQSLIKTHIFMFPLFSWLCSQIFSLTLRLGETEIRPESVRRMGEHLRGRLGSGRKTPQRAEGELRLRFDSFGLGNEEEGFLPGQH